MMRVSQIVVAVLLPAIPAFGLGSVCALLSRSAGLKMRWAYLYSFAVTYGLLGTVILLSIGLDFVTKGTR